MAGKRKQLALDTGHLTHKSSSFLSLHPTDWAERRYPAIVRFISWYFVKKSVKRLIDKRNKLKNLCLKNNMKQNTILNVKKRNKSFRRKSDFESALIVG